MSKRKRRYCTELFALRVAKRKLQQRPEMKPLRPYRCPYCQGYHLTKHA